VGVENTLAISQVQSSEDSESSVCRGTIQTMTVQFSVILLSTRRVVGMEDYSTGWLACYGKASPKPGRLDIETCYNARPFLCYSLPWHAKLALNSVVMRLHIQRKRRSKLTSHSEVDSQSATACSNQVCLPWLRSKDARCGRNLRANRPELSAVPR